MSKRNFSRTRHDDSMRRHGSEAVDGSSPVPTSPKTRRDGPDVYRAIQAARYAVTDAGVRFACEASGQGFEVLYASDWSPGDANRDRLDAAGVTLVICKEKKP